MAQEMSDEQRRRRVRRVVLVVMFLSLLIPISFLVLLIVTYRESEQHFAGARFYLGDVVLILSGVAAVVAGLRSFRVNRRNPPVPASADQRLRAGQAIRSGRVPADGVVELARAIAKQMARKYRAQTVAMAPVPLMIVALAIMFRGRALDVVVVVYALLGAATLVLPLLLARRADRFLAVTSGR